MEYADTQSQETVRAAASGCDDHCEAVNEANRGTHAGPLRRLSANLWNLPTARKPTNARTADFRAN